jgi:Na+-transporting NADH:ubiquinone oxidoreductase subunit NqrE
MSPLHAGFIKGLLLSVLGGVVSFLSVSANVEGVLSPIVAALVMAVASALESQFKANSGGKAALFGAVRVR